MASLDVVLHTSSIGESFGYGIAEPMNFGKPVIANSTPWADQAQIELVRHGECGFIAGTPAAMAAAMLTLACDSELRGKFGHAAQRHIRAISQPDESLDRVEAAIRAAVAGRDNPRFSEDHSKARGAAAYLDIHQFGHSFSEQLALRLFHYRVRFHQWRKLRLSKHA
jgi:glycosyltransferase involved in cell wall biosynthesis